MTHTKDEAFKLVLEALKLVRYPSNPPVEAAITAIKQTLNTATPLAALTAQPEPVQEPTDIWFDKCFRSDPPAQRTPVQEPVWIQPDHLQKAKTAPFLCRVEPHKRDDFVSLYTTPPAQPAVPLTYEQITDISKQVAEGGPEDSIDRFVRAIEQAHGITKGQP